MSYPEPRYLGDPGLKNAVDGPADRAPEVRYASGGTARYEDNPRHRRARLVTLTEKGRATLARIQSSQRPWANDLGAAVGERQLRQANAVLERVLEAIAARRTR
jgi:hypothetical protein